MTLAITRRWQIRCDGCGVLSDESQVGGIDALEVAVRSGWRRLLVEGDLCPECLSEHEAATGAPRTTCPVHPPVPEPCPMCESYAALAP